MLVQNIATVAGQALSLFIMMAVGCLLFRLKLFGEEGLRSMTNVLIWAITPALLINTFSRRFDPELAGSLASFAAASAAGILLALGLSLLFFRNQPAEDSSALRLCSVFSNAGFMGLPLAQALFGDEGVMYASIFVTVFNLLIWTAGYALLAGKGLSLRKAVLNPGLLGLAIGLPLFIFSVELPSFISGAVSSLAAVNTPLAMIVIGGHLVNAKLSAALHDWRVYLVCALRLLLLPFVSLLALWLLPDWLAPLPSAVLIIELGAPVAALTVPMSATCGRNSALASECVAISTLLSIVTLPILAAVAKLIFSVG